MFKKIKTMENGSSHLKKVLSSIKGFFLKSLPTLMFLCVSMNIGAQRIINLNDETANFGLRAAAAPSTASQEFLSEAKTYRAFAINPALQNANNVSIGDTVKLQIFEDNNYTATISSITTDINGTLTIMLRLPDYPMAVAFITTSTETKSLVNVSIPEQDRTFVSRINVNSANSYLLEIDRVNKLSLANDAIAIPEEGEEIFIEIEIIEEVDSDNLIKKNVQGQRIVSPTTISCSPDANLLPTDPAQIDILIVYTPAAAAWAASSGGINNVIAGAMAQTSAVMGNQRNGDSFNLVHSQQITYTEASGGNDMGTDLNRLTNPNDGFMDEVHQIRKQYNADIVVLLTQANDYGGLGWVLNNVNGSYTHAFNIVRVQQASWTNTSIHEIGHNMGMLHEVENNSISPPLFPYAYGWYWTGNNSTVYGSVMSYTGAEAPFFSNPNELYYGAATGTPTANNAQVFRNIKHVVAFYSDRINNLPDAPTNIVVSTPTATTGGTTAGGATISWDAVNGAASYAVRVFVTGSSGSFYNLTTPTNSLTFHYTNFDPCATYYFSVRAVNDCGDFADSQIYSFTTRCATDPTVVTNAATNIAVTTATLNRTVTANGVAVSSQGFMYKEMTAATWINNTTGSLTGLSPNTQYKFYAYAVAGALTVNGNVLTFTTLAPIAPTVTTQAATNVNCNSATLNSLVTAGSETINAQGFEYRASGAGSWITSSGNLTGLTTGITYEFRAYATTASGTTYGSVLTFTAAAIQTQTIDFPAIATKTYGDAAITLPQTTNAGLTISYQSSNTAVATVSGNTLTIVGAGTANITATQSGNCDYIAATQVVRGLTVNKADLTVTADNKTREYGDANPTFTISYSGWKNSDNASSLTTQPTATSTATQTSNAGTYPITVSGGVSDNYNFSYQNGTLTITKASLTVTADNKTREYGDANPAFTISYSGWKNSDNASSLTTQPTATSIATQTSNTGTYPITVSGGVSDNYNFSYQNGTLTITKASLTVTAENKTREYGEQNPQLTYIITGFKNGETQSDIDVLPTISTSATQNSNVGNYAINISGASDNNYNFSYQNGTLTITKAMLTVTADDKTREYGDANPIFTISYSGWKNSDNASSLTTQPTATSTATQTSNTGTYPITVSGGVSDNYNFSYQNGTLTITKAPLTITAEDKTRKQGEANPEFTLVFDGFKNGENESVLDELPTASSVANATSPVGFYNIVLSGGSDNNYEYTLVDGILEVTSATNIDDVLIKSISIFPNPAKTDLFIKSEVQIEKVEICDLTGKTIINSNLSIVNSIDVSALPTGIYLVKIYTDKGVVTQKLIKN